MRTIRQLLDPWKAICSSSANRSLVYAIIMIGALHWAGGWETWMWIPTVIWGWFAVMRAVLGEWAPEAIRVWAGTANLADKESEAPGPTVLLRVWSFEFRWSVKYVEDFLAARGLDFKFEPEDPEKFRGSGEFLARLKIEEHPNRLRVHYWLVPPGGTIAHPRYDWSDTPFTSEIPLWSYDFSKLWIDEPFFRWRLSMLRQVDERRKWFYRLTLGLDREPGFPPTPPTQDIFFEVPLDAEILGNYGGNPWEEHRKICRTDSGMDTRHWQCQSGRGEQFEWEWYLGLRTFEAS